MLEELRDDVERALRSGNWLQLVQSSSGLCQQTLQLEQVGTPRTSRTPAGDTSRGYLVTGGAGFIGSHVSRRLLALGHRVTVIDEFNDYYDPVLKWENVADLLQYEGFQLHQVDIRDSARLKAVLGNQRYDAIIHLAARAGVRPSLADPVLYVTSNVLGTQNMLELARDQGVANFVYASSSSVYGGSKEFPFSETLNIDSPMSPYAVTKRSNELQAACYSRLYGMAVTGLRFFTVYGPSGRPDMAVRLFIEKLGRGEPVPLFGAGDFERDYTYVDDIVDGVLGVLAVASQHTAWNQVFNLGESDTTSVLQLILMIAKELGRLNLPGEVKDLSSTEQRRLIDDLASQGLITQLPAQLGDVPKTHADVGKAQLVLGYQPRVGVTEGVRRTVRWHLEQQRRALETQRTVIQRALRLNCAIRARAGLDSVGQPKHAAYQPLDAQNLVSALAELGSYSYEPADVPLALRAQRELATSLHQVSQHIAAQSRSA